MGEALDFGGEARLLQNPQVGLPPHHPDPTGGLTGCSDHGGIGAAVGGSIPPIHGRTLPWKAASPRCTRMAAWLQVEDRAAQAVQDKRGQKQLVRCDARRGAN